LVLAALLVLGLGIGTPYGLSLWQYYQTHESTDNATVVGDLVPISTRVNGTVLAVYVKDHQQVTAGQVLAHLDPRDFALRVQHAEHAVAVAAARLQHEALEVPLAQQHTSSTTARAQAALLETQSALQEVQQRGDEIQARLRMRLAAVRAAQADVEMASARLDTARAAFTRLQSLLDDGVVARQLFEEAAGLLRTRQAELDASQAKLAQAQSEVERTHVEARLHPQAVEQARARVANAQAQLDGAEGQQQHVEFKQAKAQIAQALLRQAQDDLDAAHAQLADTTLQAPVAGVVTRKRLEPGQVVHAGRPVMTLVQLQPVWIEANFKETQLQHIRPGQKAIVRVDTYGRQEFFGTVKSINPGTGAIFSLLPPENATGNFIRVVQRIPVRIVLNAPVPGLLRPGMSAVATVATR
jgi:membrane fusion protein (multidrug efflux system)